MANRHRVLNWPSPIFLKFGTGLLSKWSRKNEKYFLNMNDLNSSYIGQNKLITASFYGITAEAYHYFN